MKGRAFDMCHLSGSEKQIEHTTSPAQCLRVCTVPSVAGPVGRGCRLGRVGCTGARGNCSKSFFGGGSCLYVCRPTWHPRRRRAEMNPIHPNFDAPPPHSRLRPLVNCGRLYPARKDTAGRQSECLSCGGCEDSSESGTKHGAIETCEIRARTSVVHFFYAGITARAKMTSEILPAVFSHMALVVKCICVNETSFSFHAVLACLDLSAIIGSNNDACFSCHWNESTDVPLLQQRARHAVAARTSPPSHRKYLPSGRAA